MLSCKEITELVSKSLDTKVPFMKRMELKMHLMMCRLCNRYAKQIRSLHNVIKHNKFDSVDESVSLSAESKDNMKQALKSLENN